MNPHYEKQLEASIRRELETLDELPAPPALANRILREIESRAATPWYRRAWPSWPMSLRFASLVILLAGFSGLCFGTWELTRSIATTERMGLWLADAQALWRTAGVLGDVACSFTQQLGAGVWVVALGFLFAACAACIGLGSACIRLAVRSDSTGSLS